MTWDTEVAALSPVHWYKCDEAFGSLADSGSGSNAANVSGSDSTYQQPSAVGSGKSILTDSSGFFIQAANGSPFGASAFSVALWLKVNVESGGNDAFLGFGFSFDSDWLLFEYTTTDTVKATLKVNGTQATLESTAQDFTTDFVFVVLTYSSGNLRLYLDGSADNTNLATGQASFAGTPTRKLYIGNAGTGPGPINAYIDEVLFFSDELTSGEISTLYNAIGAGPTTLPVTLNGYLSTAAQTVPVTLNGQAATAAQTLPMRLVAPDPTHYRGSAARWSVAVYLAGVEITDDLTGQVSITHTENQSGSATLALIPATGTIDPADYERKALEVDFVGRDSAGAVLYQVRRFTGTTSTATYGPDTGILSVRATTDLQGQIENSARSLVDSVVGGRWSKYVFDESADLWTYANDRLSTIARELHVNPTGQVVTVPFAAKATADVELTNARRFGERLRVERATRRDMISRVRLNMNFRFTRLRHREIAVSWVLPGGFCGYLDGNGELPQKSTFVSAADSNGWTRLGEITFIDLPDTGTYCGGQNFVGSTISKRLCTGASWAAGRRWAQTITETYTTTLVSPDIEAAIGQQAISEDYGVEAVYDSGDFERLADFSGPPAGATLSAATDDWQLDADAGVPGDRDDFDEAHEIALDKAKVEILARARRNRVTCDVVYDPIITLASTVRLNTPALVCKGKVFSYTETLNLITGEPAMQVTLALSRHGGSGIGSDDALDAPAKPAQTVETPTSRVYALPTHIGGITGAATESDAWDGWITNAYGGAQTDPTNRYSKRLVLDMPEIEAAARDEAGVETTAAFECVVPQDEFTMSY